MMMISVLSAVILSTLQVGGASQGGHTPTFGAQQRTPPRDATLEKKGTGNIRARS